MFCFVVCEEATRPRMDGHEHTKRIERHVHDKMVVRRDVQMQPIDMKIPFRSVAHTN